MSETTKRMVYWAPRILCIAFAGFISLFAMDVFEGQMDIWHRALALTMHMIPTALVLVALAVAWRWEWIAAVAFPALAVLHLVMMWGRLHWSAYVLIEGPLLLVGALFLASWLNRGTLGRGAGEPLT
jgi:hypothetical protein